MRTVVRGSTTLVTDLMYRLILILPILLAACQKDETISGFVDPQKTFKLEQINGKAFSANADISFPAQGTITGASPCNSYSAAQTAPYPWFEIGSMTVTRAICPESGKEEQDFFQALGEMTLIEAVGDVLILQNDSGGEMVFKAVQE